MRDGDLTYFACAHAHVIASDEDLEGTLCPVCIGKVRDWKNVIDTRMLAPLQEEF